MALPERQGLYDPRNEHDSCGIGFVANIKGRKSHDIIARGLEILVNLDHRGAVGADPLVGDGAGCLIQMPDALLRDWADQRGSDPAAARALWRGDVLSAMGRAGAGPLPSSTSSISSDVEGQTLIGWRDVPTDTTGLGAKVIETMPWISQAIVGCGPEVADQDAFERKILTIRKQVLNSVTEAGRATSAAGAARPLYAVLLDPHARLQGPAAGAAGRQLLRGSAQPADGLGAGARPSTVFDQHLPVLAARPPLPFSVPQRRDQHGSRQRQLDGGAPAGDDLGAAGARPRQDGAADRAGAIRHRLHRQCARAAGHRRRLFARPCDDDADPRGLGRQPADGRATAGVLRIPRRSDGAVGRPGGDRLHRRAPDRRHPRPQRPAAGALHRHRRRSCDHGFGGRGTAGARKRTSRANGGFSRARCC